MKTRRSPRNQDRLWKGLGADLVRAAAICAWIEDEDGNWDTDCGGNYVFIDGGPIENRMKFCLYCGKSLNAKALSEMET